jgi:hypothetical protein
MGENVHVTEGKSTGGIVGSIVCGIIIGVFFNFGTQGETAAFRIVYAILSVGNIPIAIIGQKISQKIFDLIHGKNSTGVYVSNSVLDIIMHKFAGAIIAPVIYSPLLMFLLGKIMGVSS